MPSPPSWSCMSHSCVHVPGVAATLLVFGGVWFRGPFSLPAATNRLLSYSLIQGVWSELQARGVLARRQHDVGVGWFDRKWCI
mmetsp:Transcript_3844/g.6392  ORF Transcript_3844/g.6392 Transcript_3844/m.6392 type:complete len:83 (-) Transcript_3844:135-383(-)